MQEVRKIDISDDGILRKVLAYFEGPEERELLAKAEKIIAWFPFNQLLELKGLDHEIIGNVALVLGYFARSKMLTSNQSNLECSLNFLISNLKFIAQQEDSTDTLFKLLYALHHILAKPITTELDYIMADLSYYNLITLICSIFFYSVVNLKINLDVIYNLTNNILSSHHFDSLRVKKCLYNIFIATLDLHSNTQYDESLFLTCLTELCLHIDGNLEITFEFIHGLFRLRPYHIEYPPTVFRLFEFSMESIQIETPCTVVQNCLESFFIVFKNFESIDVCLIIKEAIKKIHVFFQFLKKIDDKDYCVEVLAKLINFAFNDTPWDIEELKIQLNYLSLCQNWDIVDNEVVFISYYNELVYTHFRQDKYMIDQKIEKKLQDKFSTHPMFLKAMCLLFPAYTLRINTIKKQWISKMLLQKLEEYPVLEHLITYHISQLIWVLCSDSLPLKIKVLQLWLKTEDNSNQIKYAVNVCKAAPILLNMLFMSSDNNREKISVLLSKIDNINLKLDVMKSIPRTLHRHETLHYILKAKPTVPQDPNQSMILITQLISILPKVQSVDTLQGICTYCLRMVMERKNCPKVIQPLLSSYSIVALLEICNNATGKLSGSVLSLLRIIVIVQDKYNLKCAKSIEVDLNPIFEREDLSIKYALMLLLAIITSKVDTPIMKLVNPALAVYQTLLNKRNGEYSRNIYKALTYLLKQQECLVLSMHNIFCLEIECKKGDADMGFLLFLEAWLRRAMKNIYCRFPNDSIRRYINSLDVSKDDSLKEKVPLISNLLNKWQTLPTTSILYFSA